MVHAEESIQSLKFAKRVKKIKNKAVSNVMLSPEQMKIIINKLKSELFELKQKMMQYAADPEKAKRELAQQQIEDDTPSPSKSLEASTDVSSTVNSTPKSSIFVDNAQLMQVQTEFELYKKEK